ncbi:hypothetical protein E6H36_12600 [Candidatus Bathyarchaeota archaeon]|nr:MAG: hypothetical protein E6H36_12600 [Candidatus Bathyarchaeota archaeon]
MKLRLYFIVIIAVLTLVVPAVFLRGTLPQQTATEIDGLSHLTSIEGVSVGPTIWKDSFNNITQWTLPSSSIPAILQVNNSLKLTVAFPSKSSPQALSIYRSVNLSLDRDPLITFSTTVSSGVSYGIRFFGTTTNNASFAAWHEGSSLQHRPGLGTRQTTSVNLVAESSLANPKLSLTGARITRVLFYLEAPALTSGNFVLALYDLHARPQLHSLPYTRSFGCSPGVYVRPEDCDDVRASALVSFTCQFGPVIYWKNKLILADC